MRRFCSKSYGLSIRSVSSKPFRFPNHQKEIDLCIEEMKQQIDRYIKISAGLSILAIGMSVANVIIRFYPKKQAKNSSGKDPKIVGEYT